MKECQNIEWKETWNDDYLKWVCAFANAEGGSICVGIDDSGKIYPLKNEKKLLEDLPNKIRDVLGIIADVKLIPTESGDYIRIDVPAYPHLISYHGRFYYRSGSTVQELKGAALEQIILKKRHMSWDAVTVPGVSIDDLSTKAFDIFRRKAVENKRKDKSFLDESNASILQNLNLISNGELTRAAVLLFHPDPEKFFIAARIKLGFFQTEADIIYQDEFRGSLFEQMDQIESVIYLKYLKAYITYDGFQRRDEYLFPRAALREAILNSVIHKTYDSCVAIQIKIFEDRIVIYNAGILPENWTIEDLMKPHTSKPFNPLIAEAFYRAGEIESWGRGIEKITAACSNVGIEPPHYKFLSGYILTFDASAKLAEIKEKIQREIGGQEKSTDQASMPNTVPNTVPVSVKIVELIKTNGSLPVSEMASVLKLSLRTTRRKIAQLQAEGLIKRIGADKNGCWVISENPPNSTDDLKNDTDDLNRDLKNDSDDLKNAPEMTLIAKVVLYIKNNPQATYDDIASVIGKSQATAKRFIEKLRLDGIIERSGSPRGGHWKIVEKSDEQAE